MQLPSLISPGLNGKFQPGTFLIYDSLGGANFAPSTSAVETLGNEDSSKTTYIGGKTEPPTAVQIKHEFYMNLSESD